MQQDRYFRPQLRRYFENSLIYALYEFVKTDEARNIVKFSPQENSNTFTFRLKQLRSINPKFVQIGNNLISTLRKQGLTVSRYRKGIRVVSHSTLNVNSGEQDIFEVWLEAQKKNFLKSKSFVTAIYHILKNPLSNVARWTPEGNKIIISCCWKQEDKLHNFLRRSNFSMRRTDVLTIQHEFICRESPLQIWMVGFMRSTEKSRQMLSNSRYRRKVISNSADFKPQNHSIKVQMCRIKVYVDLLVAAFRQTDSQLKLDLSSIELVCREILQRIKTTKI